WAAAQLLEPDGQGGEALAGLGGEPRHRARIEAGGEKKSDGDIGDAMSGDAVAKGLADAEVVLGTIAPAVGRVAFSVREFLLQAAEVSNGSSAVAIDANPGAGRNGRNCSVKGERLGDVSESEKPYDSGRFGRIVDTRIFQDSLDLGCEIYGAPIVGVVKWLDSEGIPCGEEALAKGIPNDEGVHSAQAREHALALFAVEVEQHFRVA